MTDTAAPHPKDVCECGDYRHQHAPNGGPCNFNRAKGNVGHGGPPDCERFKLWRTHEQDSSDGAKR